jgi:SOS-response transcriptional repressor LexA
MRSSSHESGPEYFDIPKTVKLSDAQLEALNLRKVQTGVPISTQIRRAVEREIAGEAHPAMAGVDSLRIKRLTRVPCGDWREAIDTASPYVLSPDVKRSLEAQEGDLVVPAEGSSMEGARIFDGDEVLMRPLHEGQRPRRGDITLVQIIRKNGECEGTIKRWIKSEPVVLHDGDDKVFSLPKDVVEVKAVAVGRGLIARLF